MLITLLQALLISLACYFGVSVWPLGVGYFVFYRPLIAGTVVGLIMGDVRQGMAFGAALNAVHLGFVSTGGSLPSDLAIAGYVGTALALASGLDVDAALATFGVPLGLLGGILWFGRMTVGAWIVHWADARAAKGDVGGVAAVNLWAGQGMLLVMYAVPSFIALYFGQQGLARFLTLIPERLVVALAVVGGMLPAVGIGLLLRSIGGGGGGRRLVPYFLIGFVLVIYLELPIMVVALLGVCAAWLGSGLAEGEVRGGFGDWRDPVAEEPGGYRLPRRVRRAAWVRWVMFLHASYNYERLQGVGFAHAMGPVISFLYRTAEDRAAALRRHLVFFNTEPQLGALVPAVVMTMEEERAHGAAISDEAINSIKSGLMGPLAGVGDSLFQGVITPLFLSLGISLAQQGLLSGPVIYALLISGAVLGTSAACWSLGYRLGREAVRQILRSGWLQVVTRGASIVGLCVVGGLAATTVRVPTVAVVLLGAQTISVQADLLDSILRGLLPLLLILGVWWLLYRRVSPTRVIGFLFAAGIGLTYLGVMGGTPPPLFTRDWGVYVSGGAGKTLGQALGHLWPVWLALGGCGVDVLRRRAGRG